MADKKSMIIVLFVIAVVILIASVACWTQSPQPSQSLFVPDTGVSNVTAPPTEITVEDAKEIVAEFSGENPRDIAYIDTVDYGIGNEYRFSSPSGEYYVNEATGSIERVYFFLNQDCTGTVEYSLEEAKDRARQFAERNFPGFNAKNMTITDEEFINHGDAGNEYLLVWTEVRDGVILPSVVVISVNPFSCEIMSYMGVDRPVSIPIVPKITKDTAIATALTAYPGVETTSVDAFLSVRFDPGDRRNQVLVWNVDIRGIPKDRINQGGMVTVDASTGEILSVSSLL
jgi:hypothetical protein